MSAIYGLIHLDGQPAQESELEPMTRALLPFGPDGGGTWLRGGVALGQRLQCFTPEDLLERQPLVGAEGNCVLIADGRIDNRAEVARELGIAAAEAAQLPDSAFILRAWEKWGYDCPARLVGAFAFAVYDLRENVVFLARSGMGERAIYYHQTPRSFAFASAPKGLFALPFVPRAMDEEMFADYLVSAPPMPGRSFYAGIQSLPAGHSMLVREGAAPREFWRPYSGKQTRFSSDAEYPEALAELLERVVADQSRSITPVGVSMSGGLDSASIAAVAARQHAVQGRRLATFTEVPRPGFDGTLIPGRYADETPYVQAIARQYDNLDLNLIRTDGRFYLDGIEEVFENADAPFRNASNRPYIEAIARASGAQGVRVLLVASYGNMTFSWSGSALLRGLAASGQWGRCWREAQKLAARMPGHSPLRLLFGEVAMPLLPDPLWRTIKRFRKPGNPAFRTSRPWLIDSPIRPEFASACHVAERAEQSGHDFFGRPPADSRAVRTRLVSGHNLLADMFRWQRASFGVDKRDPAGDQRIVEFCLSLPEDQFRRDGQSRLLIRRAMQGRLPPEVLNSTRRGLQAADWLDRLRAAQPTVDLTLQRLEKSELARRALDLGRLRRLAADLNRAGSDAERQLWDYRVVLEQGLMAGCFLDWFEAGAQN